MTLSTILEMIAFAIAVSLSPGPVNMIIIKSGINNGFNKTFSFISGATLGYTSLLMFISIILIVTVHFFPDFSGYLELIGGSFILYMGYLITRYKNSLDDSDEETKCLKFYDGFLMQWLNPKAWIATIAGILVYSSSQEELIVFMSIYFICCYISLSFWGLIGLKSKVVLNKKFKFKVINMFMGSMLMVTAAYLIYLNLSQ